MGLSLQGGSWREAVGEGVAFYFPAGVGKGIGTFPTAPGTSGQMGEPNSETVQGWGGHFPVFCQEGGIFGCLVPGPCLALWSVSCLVHRASLPGLTDSTPPLAAGSAAEIAE